MKITYIFRSPSKERSIERVFVPIMEVLSKQGHEVETSVAKSCRFLPLFLLWNIIYYAFKSRKNLCHITGDIQFVGCLMNPNNTILTVHDLVLLKRDDTPPWLRKLVLRFWYYYPLKRLKHITCISETTKQDLISFFPWIANKVCVIPNPVNTNFAYREKKFNKEKPVILHIGTRTNKNLERVVKALNGVSCHLRIIGKLAEKQIKLLTDNKIYYSNDIHISDEQIVKEYEEADIISFPSLFEGFGLPIIEGQTVGRSVLTSDREPMKSVAGEHAMLVNPESVDSIRTGFLSLIENETYRNMVTQSGIVNAKLYNIENIVAQYAAIYDKIQK